MSPRDVIVVPQHGSQVATALRPRRLLGRDREVAEVTECVLSTPVTTLVGPGGVGKTALAMTVAAAAAEHFPGGVSVVWLGSLRSAALVVTQVAAQVGLTRSGKRSYEDALGQWLSERDVLLVLDNCEHVASAVADLVDTLTAQLPRLRVLATSREPLRVEAELSYRLAPLPVVSQDASLEEIAASPAVLLFQERAGAKARGSLGTERAGRLVAEICRRVDGLPLAIELAAARVAALELEDISLHLFDSLPHSARRADGAERSLRAAVEWSDALLSEEERRLLRRMGVFAGAFDLTAVKGICAAEDQSAAQIADLTARLVEKSLLMKLGEAGQYQLLETLRQYSIEQLTAAGEVDAVRDRHARFYFDAAVVEGNGMLSGSQRAHIEVLARIEDNTRTALQRLLQIEPRAALQLAGALTNFWWVQGKLREGIGWLERARQATPEASAELRATGFFCEGFLVAHDTDDWYAAAELLDRGLDVLASDGSSPPILGMLLCLRGECDVFNGLLKSAVARTQAGLEEAARYPDTWVLGFCLWNAAYARRAVGDVEAAIELFSQAITLTKRMGMAIGEMCACNVMGEIWEARGELETARAVWERALQCRRDIGAFRMGHVHGTMPLSLLAVARLASKLGDLATASTLLREALPLAEEMRDAATVEQITSLLAQTRGGV